MSKTAVVASRRRPTVMVHEYIDATRYTTQRAKN